MGEWVPNRAAADEAAPPYAPGTRDSGDEHRAGVLGLYAVAVTAFTSEPDMDLHTYVYVVPAADAVAAVTEARLRVLRVYAGDPAEADWHFHYAVSGEIRRLLADDRAGP